MTVKEQFLPSTPAPEAPADVFDVFIPDLIVTVPHVALFAPEQFRSLLVTTLLQLIGRFELLIPPFTPEPPPPILEIPGDIEDEHIEEDEIGDEDEQGAKSKPPDT